MELSTHALNESFSWPDATGPFRLVSADQAKAWNEEGYFLLENVISAADLEMLRAEIDPLEQKANLFLRGLEGKKQFIARADELTFFPHIVLRSNPVKAFVASRVFAELCLDLLGNDVRLYWDQAVYKKPGSPEEFPWHQDNGYTFIRPQDYLTCWIPLVDATVDNGCPWVVPGVHKMGTLSHWTTDLGYQCLDRPLGALEAVRRRIFRQHAERDVDQEDQVAAPPRYVLQAFAPLRLRQANHQGGDGADQTNRLEPLAGPAEAGQQARGNGRIEKQIQRAPLAPSPIRVQRHQCRHQAEQEKVGWGIEQHHGTGVTEWRASAYSSM